MAAPGDAPQPSTHLIPATDQQSHPEQGTDTESEAWGAGGCWGARHTVALLAFCGIVIDFMVQTILAVVVVAMVGQATSGEDKGDVCPLSDGLNYTNSTQKVKSGEFQWDERTQGIIQGCMNYGCAVMSLPGGRIAEMYGGRNLFGLMVVSCCLICLVMPVIAYTSTWLFIAVRVLQGMAVGIICPALNVVLLVWFPHHERSKFFSIIMSGANLGSVTCMSLAGWLCEQEWLGGWPAPFYVVGVVGLVWGALWFLLVHPTPEKQPRIRQEELHYIVGGDKLRGKKAKRIPWGPFLRCPSVWILALASAGDCFCLYIIMTMVPTYLTNILHFSLGDAGVIAALPHLLSCIVGMVWGWTVGWLTTSQTLSKRRIKQLSSALGFYIPAACMIGMWLVRCEKDAAVALLILSMSANVCNFAGHFSLSQDLSPPYSGTVLGFVGIYSSLTGVLGPLVTGLMINETQTLEAWRNVFLTCSFVYIATCTIFLAFMPVRQQHWDNSSSDTSSSVSFPLSTSSCPQHPSKEFHDGCDGLRV